MQVVASRASKRGRWRPRTLMPYLLYPAAGVEFVKEGIASEAPGSDDFIPRYGSMSGRFARWAFALANAKCLATKAK